MQKSAGLQTPIERGAKLLTLVLVQNKSKLLLGRKKRGFGEGYYNGFGGKVSAMQSLSPLEGDMTADAPIWYRMCVKSSQN